MEELNVKEVDLSLYNVEIILTLLVKKNATPYKIARDVGKEQQQPKFRGACDNLNKKDLLMKKSLASRSGIEYSINYRKLVHLFFNYFKDELIKVPSDDDYKVYEEYFSSKTISFMSKNYLTQKIKKGYFEIFLQLIFLHLTMSQMSSIINIFQSKQIKKEAKSMGRRNPISKKMAAQSEQLGIYIEEIKVLIPKVINQHSNLFKTNQHTKKLRDVFEI